MRVRVHNGDGSEYLGEGTMVGKVAVTAIFRGESLLSLHDAEQDVTMLMQPGDQLVKAGDNPKIVLDSGDTVYGCQVWWEPCEDAAAAS